MGKIKPWEELSFQDDYMFKRVMSHKRFCKRMLEKILRMEIRDIRYLEESCPTGRRKSSSAARDKWTM